MQNLKFYQCSEISNKMIEFDDFHVFLKIIEFVETNIF